MFTKTLVSILFLAISGCSKPHSPPQVQQLHGEVADFRHNVLRVNVNNILDELVSKLDAQWRATNLIQYNIDLDKLKSDKDEALSELDPTDKDGAVYILTKYLTDTTDLKKQLDDANSLNSTKLTNYKKDILAKLNSQFDRSENADIILIRYEMGLTPSTLDNYLIGKF